MEKDKDFLEKTKLFFESMKRSALRQQKTDEKVGEKKDLNKSDEKNSIKEQEK